MKGRHLEQGGVDFDCGGLQNPSTARGLQVDFRYVPVAVCRWRQTAAENLKLPRSDAEDLLLTGCRLRSGGILLQHGRFNGRIQPKLDKVAIFAF